MLVCPANDVCLADAARPCVQILEGHLRVKMFGVGRIVEGIVKDSLINVSKGGVPASRVHPQVQLKMATCCWCTETAATAVDSTTRPGRNAC